MTIGALGHATVEGVSVERRKFAASWLKKKIEPRGTGAALARHLGVDQGQVTRWSDGDTEPSGDAVVGMMQFFGVSAWVLYGIPESAEDAVASALRALPVEVRAIGVAQCKSIIKDLSAGALTRSPPEPPKPPTRPSGPTVVVVRETDADRERDRAKPNASRPASGASAPKPRRGGTGQR